MSKINNIFDWLKEITQTKSSVDSFSSEDWDKWNNYMINRFVSMEPKYIDIVNLAQQIPPQNKESLYLFYKSILPKENKYFRYIKSNNKPVPEKLLKCISKFFECSKKEAEEYYKFLDKDRIEFIIQNLGIDPKEFKSLIK
jgi:hypothetical protein